MVKSFNFHNANISIKANGFGSYLLSGLGVKIHTVDSSIYDWCNDNSDKKKWVNARKTGYKLLKEFKNRTNTYNS